MDRAYKLAELLNEHNLLGVGAEIGVQRGRFASRLLSAWPGHLLLVDAWRRLEGYDDITNVSDAEHEEYYQIVLGTLGTSDRVSIMRMLSSEATSLVADGSLDFVYIDANHSYEAVKADLQLWWPNVKLGGLFSGHDYLDAVLPEGTFDVKRAVDEFARTPVSVIEGEWPSWYYFKERA